MQPMWKLSEEVPLDEQFELSQSWTLQSAADAFIWSDFLGEPTAWLPKRVDISGRLTLDQKLEGRLTEDQVLAGRLTEDKKLEGDV